MTTVTTPTETTQPAAERPDAMHDGTTARRVNFLPIDELGLASRKAWLTYIGLALVPPGAMIFSIFYLLFQGGATVRSFGGIGWLMVGMFWLGIAVPGSFFVRRRIWNRWYTGEGVVRPDEYMKGNLVVWGPMVVGGVMGFIGTALTAGPASLFTSITALILFLTQAPDASALTKPVGDHDDPAVYQEPK